MRRFYWLGAGPVAASCDLRRLGWEMLDGRGLGGGELVVPVIGCAAHMAVRQWIELSAATPVSRALVLLTGIDDSRQRLHLLASGVGDALSDGLGLEELALRAQRVAERATMIPATQTVGPLEIDLLARDARHGTRWAGLNPREFALLWRLAQVAGRAVPAQVLLREVWGLRFKPETNSLAVHVCRLRGKLRNAGLAGMITTLADGSYRLERADDGQFALDGRSTLRKDDSKYQTNTWEQDKYHAA